jgi:hypothetical protein
MMHRRRAGFSVIEFLIYFLIMSLLFMVSIEWILHMHRRYKKNKADIFCSVKIGGVIHYLRCDIQRISTDECHWKLFDYERYIWSDGSLDIGWELKKRCLWRSEGHYKADMKTWSKRSKSLIAQNIDDCTLRIKREGDRVVGVTIVVRSGNMQLQQFVCIYKGRVV